jgi:hypothetical protein
MSQSLNLLNPLPKIAYQEFLQRVAPEARAAIVRWWDTPGTSALVYFDNPLPSHAGEASVVAVGPGRHVKRPEDVLGTHLNELPELRQYPRFFCQK